MAKKLNQTRYSRAKLIIANIETYGKHYAFEYGGADGFSIINVDPISAPTDIKEYLVGNLTLTSYPVSKEIPKLCAYALASFPNLESVYLFKTDDMVELEQDALFGLDNLDGVYVPDFLYDSYVATYPAYADLFKKIISTYDLEIPTFTGVTKLTKEIFTQVVGMLGVGRKSAVERVVVPAQYTELETECFEAISELPNCDTIVLEAITSAEADFMKGNTSISYIELHNTDFSLQGVADSTGTANFKWLTPIAYMHDYIYRDYVKDYYVTCYVSITNGQAMPSREEYGYWKWYSSPTTTDDTYLGDSETYPTATYSGKAYAFLIIDSVIIKGTGSDLTLTAEIVQNAIDSIDTEISPLSVIKWIKAKANYTNFEENCLKPASDLGIAGCELEYDNYTMGYSNEYFKSGIRAFENVIMHSINRPSTSQTSLWSVGLPNVQNLTIVCSSSQATINCYDMGFRMRLPKSFKIIGATTLDVGNVRNLLLQPSDQNLEHLYFENVTNSFTINGYQLSREALVELIKGLATVDEQQTLTIGATNKAKLTAEDIAVAQAKGWLIAPLEYNQKIPNNLIDLDTQTSQVPSGNLMGSYVSIINPIPVGHKVYAKITTDDPNLRLVWYKNGTSGYDFATGELVSADSQPSNAVEGIYEITSDMIYTDGYLQLYYYVFAGLPTGQHHITIQLVDLTALGMGNIISVPIFKATELGKQLDIANLPYKD